MSDRRWKSIRKNSRKNPHIAEELGNSSNKVKVDSGYEEKLIKKDKNKGFQGYDPSVIDFIRRCKKIEEAESIITYLEKKGEISKKYGKEIRKQIKEKGIRSFGSKKQENYYFNNNKIK